MAGYTETDDVTLVKLEISNSRGKSIDLKGTIVEIDVFEDIYEPSLYCELTILDSINIIQDLPIIGEETLNLTFKTPGGESASYTFFVYSAHSIGYGKNGRFLMYKLSCVSNEHLKNSFLSVEKAYKTNISEIVRDILNSQLSTNKTIHISSTKGINEVNIPSLSPFEAISFLKNRSIDTTGFSPFVFFENKNGYYFYSIESLYKENKSKSSKYKFTHGNHVTAKDDNATSYRNIINLEYITKYDTIEKIALGAFGNKVLTFDPIQKKQKESEYKIDTDGSKIFSVNDSNPTNTSEFMSKNNTTSHTYFFSDNPTQGKTFLADLVGKRSAFFVHFNQSVVRCLINGDSSLAAGNVVDLKIPTFSGLTDETKRSDKMVEGNFMITRLRHIIQKTDGKFKHRIAMDCNRLGYKS